MKITPTSILFLILFAFVFSSCKKEKDNPAPPTQTTKEIPPRDATGRSTLQPKTVLNEDTFDLPTNVKLEGQEKTNIDILTGTGLSGGRSQASYLGWYVEKVKTGGVIYPATTLYAFFFHSNGYYDFYDVDKQDWTWGTWYIDPYFNYIAFDLNTQYQEIWKIELITNNRLVILDKKTQNEIVFNSFDYATDDSGEYEVTSNVQTISKRWKYTSYSYQYENEPEISAGQLQDCLLDDILDFGLDGTLSTDNGRFLCEHQDTQFMDEWWSFSDDESELVYTEGSTGTAYNFYIESLTADELTISIERYDDQRAEYYVAYYTFTPY